MPAPSLRCANTLLAAVGGLPENSPQMNPPSPKKRKLALEICLGTGGRPWLFHSLVGEVWRLNQRFMIVRLALCPRAAALAWVPQAFRASTEKVCELMRTKALLVLYPYTSSKFLN